MTTHQEMLDLIGQTALDHGWTLTIDAMGADRLQVTLRANVSPYGAQSSRERAKSRVSVLSHLAAQQAVAQQAATCTFNPSLEDPQVCIVCGRQRVQHHTPGPGPTGVRRPDAAAAGALDSTPGGLTPSQPPVTTGGQTVIQGTATPHPLDSADRSAAGDGGWSTHVVPATCDHCGGTLYAHTIHTCSPPIM